MTDVTIGLTPYQPIFWHGMNMNIHHSLATQLASRRYTLLCTMTTVHVIFGTGSIEKDWQCPIPIKQAALWMTNLKLLLISSSKDGYSRGQHYLCLCVDHCKTLSISICFNFQNTSSPAYPINIPYGICACFLAPITTISKY